MLCPGSLFRMPAVPFWYQGLDQKNRRLDPRRRGTAEFLERRAEELDEIVLNVVPAPHLLGRHDEIGRAGRRIRERERQRVVYRPR